PTGAVAMRVLVTGASGFLGRHVVRQLSERGHAVRALVRSPDKQPSNWSEGVEVVHGDLRQRDLAWLVQDLDAVVHLAAAVMGDDESQFINTVVATENLLEAVR